jgi:hypothetical protein
VVHDAGEMKPKEGGWMTTGMEEEPRNIDETTRLPYQKKKRKTFAKDW